MKFELKKVHRNTSEDELIADLKNTATKLNQDFVTHQQQNEFGKFDASNIADRLGGWAKAHERAGLNLARHQKSQRLNDEDLFLNLEEVWTKLGHQPIKADMFPPLSRYSSGVYEKHFGTWMKALEIFVEYINSDKTEEEAVSNSASETTSIDDVSGQVLKHKTRREISDRLRFRILMRDGFACKKCGRSPIKERDVELHVDHITPWSKGGETTLENLETKCSQCNLGKGNAFNE